MKISMVPIGDKICFSTKTTITIVAYVHNFF